MRQPALMAVQAHYEGINWGRAGIEETDSVETPPWSSDPYAQTGPDHVDADFVWFQMAGNEQFRGPEGYLAYLRRWRSAFPDGWWELTALQLTGSGAVCESTFRGRHDRLLQIGGSLLPATGLEVSLPMCDVFRIRNGRLVTIYSYFDLATLVQQLGRAPAPGFRPQHLFIVN
jgi:predicted ester cyclase